MPKIISFVVYLLVETDFDAPLRGNLRAVADDSPHAFSDGEALLALLRRFRQQISEMNEQKNDDKFRYDG